MGLGITHDSWQGAYSSFGVFREALAREAGIGDPFKIGRFRFTNGNLWGDWEETPEDPLWVLLVHYDCEGIIRARDAGPLADRLEKIMENMKSDHPDPENSGIHWVEARLRATTQQFINGLRAASAAEEDLEFY